MPLIAELKRRNVFRVGAAYVICAWVIAQVADLVLDNIEAPDWVMQAIMLLLAIGFPLALVFAWAFELTPEGIKRESEADHSQSTTRITGRKFDRAIVAGLVVALGYFIWESRFAGDEQEPAIVEQSSAVAGLAEEVSDESEADVESAPIDQSIAVLPFVNMSDDASNEFFSDGISEELINLLTRIPQLKVIARTSSFSFKGKDTPIAEIADKLNVAHVLEGSVRKSGNQVRITAQLIRASDSTHLWSDSYDRKLENIFQIQDEIAAAVVAQLKIKLLGEVPKVSTTDPEAYALLLQADQAEAFAQIIELTQKASAIDPKSSLVWSKLAHAHAWSGPFGYQDIDTAAALARDAAGRALGIDPDNALAEIALGSVAQRVDLDLAAAARHFERALTLEPANPLILWEASELVRHLGRFDDAIALAESAVSRDPVSPFGHHQLGWAYFEAGRLDEAIASLRTALSLSPELYQVHMVIGLALLVKGEPEAALEVVEQESEELFRLEGLAYVHHALGNAAESDAALDELIAKYERSSPMSIARLLAYRGEFDRAFEWFEKAVEYQDGEIVNPDWEVMGSRISDDPRWLPFLESIGMAPHQLDAIEFNVTLPESTG
jgi:TolB-like protein/Tfp pilus assembly protein PilF